MGRVSGDQDFHAMTIKATAELLKGKELATRLQAHLQESDGLAMPRQLALQISTSFADALSTLSSSADRKKPPPGAKDRRGCYKRRRSLDSWDTLSSTKDDGFAWRKYGQKDIMSSKHPRCYYRCSHKPDGCKATKQVQRTKQDPTVYQTTYFNHHSCREAIETVADSDTVQELKENGGHSDQDISSNEAKSTLEVQWDDVDTGLESLGYKPEWASSGLDMEVNELGDIDYSVF